MTTLTGETKSFSDFKGQRCLIVNVASRCGLTPQYEGLRKLQETHTDSGVVVLGFPCNQFGAQEPGSDEEILEFVTTRYQVNFPMFSKVNVNGPEACELYQWLTKEMPKEDGDPDIAWNFTKFLVGPEGKVLARFEPTVAPDVINERLKNA